MGEDKLSYIKIEDKFQFYSVDMFSVPKHYKDDLDSVMLPHGLILDRTERMAKEIFDKLDHSKPLVALCVLKGGYQFFHDLIHHLTQLNSNSSKSCQISLDFIRLKSYQNGESSGEVKVIGSDDLSNLEGKNVLVVEDMIDTGKTMQKLLNMLTNYNPHSLNVASLLVKRTPKSSGYRPHYIGFEVPDIFLVGYALDYNEFFRDLKHLCIMNPKGIEKYSIKPKA